MKQYRWLVLTFCLLAALVCYLIGFAIGLSAFLLAGVAFELAFWLNLLKRNQTK